MIPGRRHYVGKDTIGTSERNTFEELHLLKVVLPWEPGRGEMKDGAADMLRGQVMSGHQ